MRLNKNNTFIGINPPYQLVIHSSKLIYPARSTSGVECEVERSPGGLQRVHRHRAEGQLPQRQDYVMDGQHTHRGPHPPQRRRGPPDSLQGLHRLMMEQEALLFAEQNGHRRTLSASSCAGCCGGKAMRLPFLSQLPTGAVPQLRQYAAELTTASAVRARCRSCTTRAGRRNLLRSPAAHRG